MKSIINIFEKCYKCFHCRRGYYVKIKPKHEGESLFLRVLHLHSMLLYENSKGLCQFFHVEILSLLRITDTEKLAVFDMIFIIPKLIV